MRWSGFTNGLTERALPAALLSGILITTACGDSTGASGRVYSAGEIDHFVEITIGSEDGSPQVTKKWTTDLRIDVHGQATAYDSATINSVVADLNQLIGDQVQLILTPENPNVNIWFVPVDSMPEYDSHYVPGNLGYFYVYWHDFRIYRANILIGSDRPTQLERAHLIREELTQSLGLMNDSERYPESIFYKPWTTVTEYTALDRTVIRMLYRAEIRAGMDERQVRSVLRGIKT